MGMLGIGQIGAVGRWLKGKSNLYYPFCAWHEMGNRNDGKRGFWTFYEIIKLKT